jgi:signal peptidase II
MGNNLSDPDCPGEGRSPSTGGFLSNLFRNLFGDKLLFWVLVLLFVVVDLWTKKALIAFVEENNSETFLYGASPIIWLCGEWLGLVSVENTGGPFGVFAGSLLLRVVRFLALGVILYLLSVTPRKARVQIIALALIMGGALGNIWDTVAYGSVRDFLYVDLDFPPADPWPAFNFADSCICTGVALLALMLYIDWLREKKSKAAAKRD